MLTKNEFVRCLEGITYVQTRQQKRRYKLKLNGDYIEGEGLDNNPRLSFEISVDDLYDAYKDGADTTVKLKGYKSLRWKQSPSLAILDKVRSGSVKDND